MNRRTIATLQEEINNLNGLIERTRIRSDDWYQLKNRMAVLLNELHIQKREEQKKKVITKRQEAQDLIAANAKKDPDPVIKYLIKEVPKEVIKEVPFTEYVEVIKEVYIPIAVSDKLPPSLTSDEYMGLINALKQIYIKTNCELLLGDIVEMKDGTLGIIRDYYIDDTELKKKNKGIYLKAKKLRLRDGEESERFVGSDRRGVPMLEVKFIEHKIEAKKKPVKEIKVS